MSQTLNTRLTTRGRKADESLPPNHKRDIGRAFRARRVALIQHLTERNQELEEENARLKATIAVLRSTGDAASTLALFGASDHTEGARSAIQTTKNNNMIVIDPSFASPSPAASSCTSNGSARNPTEFVASITQQICGPNTQKSSATSSTDRDIPPEEQCCFGFVDCSRNDDPLFRA